MLDKGIIALLNYDENNLVLKDEVGDTSKSVQQFTNVQKN